MELEAGRRGREGIRGFVEVSEVSTCRRCLADASAVLHSSPIRKGVIGDDNKSSELV
jgi:hypothetical protein